MKNSQKSNEQNNLDYVNLSTYINVDDYEYLLDYVHAFRMTSGDLSASKREALSHMIAEVKANTKLDVNPRPQIVRDKESKRSNDRKRK